MHYLLLNLVFTSIAALVVWPNRKLVSISAVIPAGILLTVLTVLCDNFIVAAGIVDYDNSRILGVRLPVAPIEDLGYLLVGVFLIPVIFRLSERYFANRKRNADGEPADE